MKRILFLIIILCIQVLSLVAGNLEKAFERLQVYDYFNARDLFLKSMKKEPVAASYGLSKIHASGDNPFYNLDSARTYILLSDSLFSFLNKKQQEKYITLNVTVASIQQMKDSVCSKAFLAAEKSESLIQLNHYLDNYSFCAAQEQARELRNSIAFKEARILNSAAGYLHFLSTYPAAQEFNDAQNRYHERVFDEQTQSRQLGAYERFILTYPESPYKMQAERMIYNLSTSQGTLAEHKAFIRRYPANRYVRESWREIYRISIQSYDEQTYLKFKFDFPEYPYMDELENDYKRQTSLFLPFNKNSLWGFINEAAEEMIAPVYEEVNYFSEGLSAVAKDGKYGYINKSGKLVIPFMWDDAEPFKNNCAVVSKVNKFGLISRSGEFLIPVEYEELSEPVEDICVVMNNGKSGYIDKTGKEIGKLEFDLAEDFLDGFAIVGIDDLFGLINSKGSLVVDAVHEHLSWASSEILKAGNNEKWGLINRVGEIVLPVSYDAIGEFHEGFALVAKNGKCGFINSHGEIIIPLIYRFTESLLGTAIFSNAYVLLSVKGKNTVLDTTGARIQFPGYENAGSPAEGLIPVQKNRKWGYVDYNGKLKIPCIYQEAYPFSGRTALVKSTNLTGLIDTTGKWILDPVFEDVKRSNTYLILSQHGMFGLALTNGTIIASCEYDRVEILFDQVAMMQREDARMYISLKNGKRIWGNLP